MEIPSH